MKVCGLFGGLCPTAVSALSPACEEPFRREPVRSIELDELLASDEWPEAVCRDLICDDTEADKFARAEQILDFMILGGVAGRRFLDFGCGEGHTVLQAIKKGAVQAEGYEVHGGQEPIFDVVHHHTAGYYDVILLYDVLDHVVDGTMKSVLAHAAFHLASGGKIVLRCHPWTSRHGEHHYRRCNKAFVHLALTPGELADRGLVGERVARYRSSPLTVYEVAIARAGLKVENRNLVTEDVEPFFEEDAAVRDRILATLGTKQLPSHLDIVFADYILTK